MNFIIKKLKIIALLSCLFISKSMAQNTSLPPLFAEFSFTIEAKISAPIMMGDTVDGRRLSIPITGGRFYGQNIQGTILPGGADYQLIRKDGVTQLHAVYMMRTDDGALINVINDGLIVPESNNQAFYFRTAPKFIAPNGKYDWLNKALFVGGVRIDNNQKGIVFIDVYKLQ